MSDGQTKDTVRWGILGAANIAIRAVMPALQGARNGKMVAIGSRDLGKSRSVAAQFNIPRAYGTYEELIEDPNVDAIYIPLPNHLHAPWTEKAAAAGKHVLCEKPLALNADEAQAMVDACQRHGVLLMEAFMYRFHPRIRHIRRIIDADTIGPVRLVRASFTFQFTRRPNIRLDPAMGGGALMDVGCYGVNFSRYVMGAEPSGVFAYHRVGDTGVDTTLVGLLQFDSGRLAEVDCSFEIVTRRSIEVAGTLGTIEAPVTWIPGLAEATLVVDRANDWREVITFPGVDQYRLMVEEFGDAVLTGGAVPLPPSDAVANMRVIDALLKSASEGRVVSLT
ncbi:MAG: Gfo/Idh/MocA family oxidoreductase [Anaerolineae bacterium]